LPNISNPLEIDVAENDGDDKFRTGSRNVAVSGILCTRTENGPKRANDHQSPKYPSLTGNLQVNEFNGGDVISAAVLFSSVGYVDCSVYIASWAAYIEM